MSLTPTKDTPPGLQRSAQLYSALYCTASGRELLNDLTTHGYTLGRGVPGYLSPIRLSSQAMGMNNDIPALCRLVDPQGSDDAIGVRAKGIMSQMQQAAERQHKFEASRPRVAATPAPRTPKPEMFV